MKRASKSLFLNVIGFQIGWWACVLGPLYDMSYLGPIVMGGFLLIHIRFVVLNRAEMVFMLISGILGTALDSLKAASGFITYAGGYANIPWLAPLWITAMWVGFASLINHALIWLKFQRRIAALAGVIMGPLTYIGVAKLGVIQINFGMSYSILILAGVWGLAVPLLYWLSDKLHV